MQNRILSFDGPYAYARAGGITTHVEGSFDFLVCTRLFSQPVLRSVLERLNGPLCYRFMDTEAIPAADPGAARDLRGRNGLVAVLRAPAARS